MNVTIYFQKRVWELFKDEPDKSKVINSLLENHYVGRVNEALNAAPVPTEDREVPEVMKDDFKQFLKDYTEVGVRKAPHPIYGYPCCHKKVPCKHWQWDEFKSEWVNELTGETREG